MKFCCFIVLGLLSIINCSAQVHKVYTDSKGNLGVDRRKAVSYMLIRKNADSDFSVQKYNMRDTILMKGNYKDSSLSVPNGKFVFYKKRIIPERLKGTMSTDTNNYVEGLSYYSNGAKTGMWVEFSGHNVKRSTYVYKNNKLNGTYQRFHRFISNYVLEEGEFIDDKKEGEWNFYGYDTMKTPLVTQLFKGGKLQKQINHIKLAYFSGDPNKYLRKSLKIPDTIKTWHVEVEVVITAKGDLQNPKLIRSSLITSINNALLSALLTLPKFIPEFHDGTPISGKYRFTVSKKESLTSLGIDYDAFLLKEVGNGMSIESRNGLVEEHSLWPDDYESRRIGAL